MKKSLLFVLCFFSLSQVLNAQTIDTIDCDKPDRDTTELESIPWFGNNAYLESFLDSIGYPSSGGSNRIVGLDRVKYLIPIKFWVYRSNNGTGGPTVQDLQNYIDNLNRLYNIDNRTWIGFYMKCSIGFIDDDSHVDVESDGEATGLIQDHKERGCINIHIANTLSGNANGIQYRARFFGIDGIFLARRTYTNTALSGTIAHEVGHYFELDHTHQYSDKGKCRKEAIDRNRTWPFITFCPFGGGGPSSQKVCEATGDLLKDTPADHELNSNNSCNYIITGQTDPWGDHYETPPTGSLQPDTRNILSYNGQRGCRNVFSRLQIAVMLYSIERGKSKNNRNAWKDTRAEYDEYEMDNFSEVARNINLNELQQRNFHQQYEETGAVWSQCDVDWVRFTAPCTNSFTIATSAIQNRTNANTRLTLFSNTLTQLAQNDDISGSNQFSSITFNFTAGTQYFIRVENMASLITGYYNLQITPANGIGSIAGPDPLCSPSTYSINNLPQGLSVVWSVSPSNIVSLSCTNCNQTTASVIGNGSATITANVGGCATYTRTISVGVPNAPIIFASNYDAQCGTFFEAYCTEPAGWTGFRWDINFGQHVQDQSGNFTNYVYLSPLINQPQTGQQYYNYVSVQARNACGLSAPSETLQFTVGPVPSNCGGGGGPILLRVAPNPGTNTVIVETTDNTKFSQLRIYDRMGNLRKQLSFPATKKLTLNVSDIPAEIYNIRVFTNNSWRSTGFIKQ